MPRVTVLMPAYNVEQYIDESIESVLAQTYEDFELLIVNDCSTDSTVARIQSYADARIRLVHTPENLKLCRALNYGLQHCTGEYIARLDSDDNATPDRLEVQVNALDENPDWVLVGADSNMIDSEGKLLRRWEDAFRPRHPLAIKFGMMFKNVFRHSSVMFRRDAINALGGYPVEWHDVEDYGLWTKLLKSHNLANQQLHLCDYRVHSTSMMARAKQNVEQTSKEPRRETMQGIYTFNAINSGAPKELAEKWGELWAKVRLPVSNEDVALGETHQVLKKLAALRPIDDDTKFETRKMLYFAYSQLVKAAFRQRSYMALLPIVTGAIGSVGTSFLVGEIFNRPN